MPIAAAVRTFGRDAEGATAAEYGIIVVLMAAIAFAVIQGLNGSLESLFGAGQDKMDNAAGYTP